MIANKLTNSTIIQYASQLKYVPQTFIIQLENEYIENNDKDFLLGVISGFSSTYDILKSNDKNAISINAIGFILAFLSDKYLKL